MPPRKNRLGPVDLQKELSALAERFLYHGVKRAEISTAALSEFAESFRAAVEEVVPDERAALAFHSLNNLAHELQKPFADCKSLQMHCPTCGKLELVARGKGDSSLKYTCRHCGEEGEVR